MERKTRRGNKKAGAETSRALTPLVHGLVILPFVYAMSSVLGVRLVFGDPESLGFCAWITAHAAFGGLGLAAWYVLAKKCRLL